MSILDELDALAASVPKTRAPKMAVVPAGVRPEDDNLLGDVFGRRAPETSDDLRRILALPRRKVSDHDQSAMAELMTRRLRKPDGPCRCREQFGRPCILKLKPAQGWALYELRRVGGLLGAIVVGGGKTGLDLLAAKVVDGVRTAVLLVPPTLVEQIIRDYDLWSQHWHVPSLIAKNGKSYLHRIVSGEPVVHVVPYSQLSRPESTTRLETLAPDLIIADEAHRLRNADTARTSRFLRYFMNHPEAKFCGWSGSLTDKSIRDYGHLSALALRDSSPLPLKADTLTEWAAAIDPPPPGQAPAPMGALAALCKPGQSLRDAFKARLRETRGFVGTTSAGIGASIYMHAKDPGPIPESVANALDDLRATWTRPDGEEFTEAIQVVRCARELTAGFYYRWIFPRGEPVKLIEEWLDIRREWAREVRAKLAQRQPHLDSPMLLAKAAMRYYDQEYDGDLPQWKSQFWPAWKRIRGEVRPETEAVWLDDYLARDAADWGEKHRGIIWYQHRAFGLKLAEISGLPLHGGGPGAGERIAAEKGDRSIIASINSHGEGRDGLQFLFDRQLVANPPESRATGGAARWEQLLGRLHRQGQEADELQTWLYRHTPEMRESFDRALELAQYVTDTIGSYQKLLAVTTTWPS